MAAQASGNEEVNDVTTPASNEMIEQPPRKLNRFKFSPSLQKTVHPVTVPVSLYTLPIYIDELWKTIEDMGDETFKEINFKENKDCLKKGMLILAEAKICCAQQNVSQSLPEEDLPQKDLYSRKELEHLSSLFKQLPYPLVIYLDCLGNTNEGKKSVTPVLVEMEVIGKDWAGTTSCGPRQLLSLMLTAKPKITDRRQRKLLEDYLLQRDMEFWLTAQGKINLRAHQLKLFQKTITCWNKWYFNMSVNLLQGRGSMAQTVQTPYWSMNGSPVEYFCMTDIPEIDQKLGATFGFSFANGFKVKKSRYSGSFETAYCRGEVSPS